MSFLRCSGLARLSTRPFRTKSISCRTSLSVRLIGVASLGSILSSTGSIGPIGAFRSEAIPCRCSVRLQYRRTIACQDRQVDYPTCGPVVVRESIQCASEILLCQDSRELLIESITGAGGAGLWHSRKKVAHGSNNKAQQNDFAVLFLSTGAVTKCVTFPGFVCSLCVLSSH